MISEDTSIVISTKKDTCTFRFHPCQQLSLLCKTFHSTAKSTYIQRGKQLKYTNLIFRVDICFSFQYYGGKESLTRRGFIAHMQHIESVFKLKGICDPSNHTYDKTVFIQDIALTIRFVFYHQKIAYLSCHT